MKLLSFEYNGVAKIGILHDANQIVDLSRADPSLPHSMLALLQGGPQLLEQVARCVDRTDCLIPLQEVKIKAPVQGMEKVIGIGLNYKDHAKEIGASIPAEPVFFIKFPSCIIGPNESIILPPESKEVDYEVELVIVIGKAGRRISVENAEEYIAGYTIGHDVSARDWQLRRAGGQWDAEDEVDLENAKIELTLNGNKMQSSTLNQLGFKPDQIVAFMSKLCTLRPGDVIFTGTPGGVGFARKPPIFMKHGDSADCYIEGIGTLTNPVEDEVLPN